MVKNPPVNAGDTREVGSIPRLGRSAGEGSGNPLQYSCLENPMDRRAWWATVHGITKSWTQLSECVHTHTHIHTSISVDCYATNLTDAAMKIHFPVPVFYCFFLCVFAGLTFIFKWNSTCVNLDFPGGSDSKVSAYNVEDMGSIPGSGRSPGEGNGNPLQYSCLENPMDGGAW